MDAEPNCLACDAKRTLISVVPVKNRHEMLSFECPKCGSIFRLVTRREPRLLPDGISRGRSAMAVDR